MEVMSAFAICPIGGAVPYRGAYFTKNLLGIIPYSFMKKHLIFLITLQPLADLVTYRSRFLIYLV